MAQNSIQYAGKTDPGLKRTANQDHYLVADLTRSLRVESTSMSFGVPSRICGGALGHLFLVADGMGGHQAGNRASELAIHCFVANILNSLRWVIRPDGESEQRFLSDLKEFLISTHRAIVADSHANVGYKGMGTTLTAAYIVWPKMWIVHAGDTRCYLLRDHSLRQITRDHNLASQLIEQGAIEAKDAKSSQWANILWNALGADAKDVVADIYVADVEPGDRILLCSDGLNKHVDDQAIARIVDEEVNPEAACQMLIDHANEAGGSDNITTIVIHCVNPPERKLITSLVPTTETETIVEDLTRFEESSSASDTGPWAPAT